MATATSSQDYSLRRIFGKLYQGLARSNLVPSRIRTRLYQKLGVNFSHRASVFIGEDVYFDDGKPWLITVGKSVRITTGARIFTHFYDTRFAPEPGRPHRFFDGEVKIGDYVFIGANAVIAKPVVIGDWAVIGANTVIAKDVPRGAIMIGSPARQVGSRNLDDLDVKNLENNPDLYLPRR